MSQFFHFTRAKVDAFGNIKLFMAVGFKCRGETVKPPGTGSGSKFHFVTQTTRFSLSDTRGACIRSIAPYLTFDFQTDLTVFVWIWLLSSFSSFPVVIPAFVH